MAVAPDSQRRRLPGLELLQSAPPRPAEPLKTCLGALQREWRKDDHLAALWQDWPRVAGAQLAPHCQPLSLQRGVLTVGASHPQWRQALLYNRPQLISALHQAGHAVRDLRIQQHHSLKAPVLESEASIWAQHPSRTDVHGMGICPDCSRPAPNGEIKLWGHCGFCHRQTLSES